MESRNRNVWIIVIVAVVLLCCCALAIAAAVAVGTGWFTIFPTSIQGGLGTVSEVSERTFDVGSTPSLTVQNFAGNITVRAGAAGQIQVSVTEKGTTRASLDNIQVAMNPQDGGLSIQTTRSGISGNLSVQLEIVVPADALLDLHTGAGSIDVSGFANGAKVDSGAGSLTIQDVTGALDAHTGAGSLDVRGATGSARLNTGAGSISYQGTPQGNCRFETGTGSIQLALPAELNATVDLGTGVGDIQLGGFAVQGQVSRRSVQGTIGSGDQVQIYAHTGTGSINLIRQ
jgi:DUF4097 and DUF4098 domain-containing protein YvlB